MGIYQFLHKEIKLRKKLKKIQDRASSEYCKYCNLHGQCKNSKERKEFKRQHNHDTPIMRMIKAIKKNIWYAVIVALIVLLIVTLIVRGW
ncbi:MAG TPA: hypothetical protein ENI23_16070 [bacterium]|nr:hypothetical protein [bacterium]